MDLFDEAEADAGDAGAADDLFGEDVEFVAEPEAADAPAAGGAAAAAADSKSKAVDPSQRVTSRYMTKYERARLLGTRALQLR